MSETDIAKQPREIRFRAWDKLHKRMQVVTLLDLKDGINGFGDGSFPDRELHEADTDILMQYTGLKDKNGKEIYEGDILRHDLWGNSIIVWELGMFRGQSKEHDITLADHQLKRSKVIGNIYETPEIANGK